MDIDEEKSGEVYVLDVNNGFRSVPTILFADGSTLTEPSDADLATKLGV